MYTDAEADAQFEKKLRDPDLTKEERAHFELTRALWPAYSTWLNKQEKNSDEGINAFIRTFSFLAVDMLVAQKVLSRNPLYSIINAKSFFSNTCDILSAELEYALKIVLEKNNAKKRS